MKFEVSGDHHQVCDVGEILIADTSLRPLPSILRLHSSVQFKVNS